MKSHWKILLNTSLLISSVSLSQVYAAVSLDRTRIIFDGSQDSVSLSVNNENKQLPYLAQGWLEDTQGNKIQAPLTVLPPVQRIEPGAKSQVRVQALPAAAQLAQDRETLYYFSLREIPPRSNKPNTLQLALQTRIKLFYRPQAITPKRNAAPWQEQITLSRSGAVYKVNNPTPYYVTLVEGRNGVDGKPVSGFEALMIAPKSEGTLKSSASALGNHPVLTYINDYGGRPQLKFTCSGNHCTAEPVPSKA